MNIYLKTFLGMSLGMAVALGMVQGFVALNDASKETILSRVNEAQQALPKIVKEEQELMMMYGSSMVQAGFSPRQFDRQVRERGKEIKSFNFGFGGLNPFFQDYLARRIKDEFEKNDRRLKLTVIEFNPFQASQARWNGALPAVDSYLTMLASDEELWEIAKNDLTRGIRLFTIKYLRNDVSAQMITSYYGRFLFPGKRPQRFEDDEEVVKRRREIGQKLSEAFRKEYPDYVDADWDYPWQGGGTIPEERSAETLALFDQYYPTLQTDASMKNRRLARIRSADIEDMNFEPLLVESFINIVKSFQQISDKVDVVLLPRNMKWIQYTEGGKKRLAQAIAQIEAATGITIKNHQQIDGIDEFSFRDATHLARYRGDVVYTEFLVDQYFQDL